ncbi:hypothetical protein BC829DRAFT_61258 [Chytridium lagenaria]|nr:hypothetical protein BC829DRAFT_61258 [Chytridium lagenaria]
MSCLAVMWKSGSFTENSFNPVPLNLDILFSEFPDIPSIAGTIFPMLKTPSTTAHSTSTMDVNEGRSPFGFDGSASLWIDRAIVEKYYRSGRFLPFEVIRRQTMLQNFDNYSMPLRSAMCALSAILSAPPAPVEVVDRYYGEARRQMMESLEHSPTIETAQTALMLALISMLLGKYPAVFMLAGMAVRMMSYLHLDTTEALQSLGHLSEDQETPL